MAWRKGKWIGPDRVCRECRAKHRPKRSGLRGFFCSLTCRKKFRSRRDVAKLSAERLARRRIGKTCGHCSKIFIPGRWFQRNCKSCRKAIERNPRQSKLFRIEGMVASEFAFKTIAERSGMLLRHLPGTRLFQLNGTSYTPDFHDPQTDTYYEVVGTRQAYHQIKRKIRLFIDAYPSVRFKVVRPDGSEFDILRSRSREREGGDHGETV